MVRPMVAQNIDGKAIALSIRGKIKQRAEAFSSKYGRQARLDVVLVGDDPASIVYVTSKEKAAVEASMLGRIHRFPTDTSEATVLELVKTLNADSAVDGILIQLPLPKHIRANVVLDLVDPRKDVDGLHPDNAGLLTVGRPGLRPCTPLGCMALLDAIGCKPEGKRAVIVGRSNLVGKPVAFLLLEQNATVTIAHSKTRDLPGLVREADIVVAAVGKPEFVQGDWIRDGAIVIDVGINRVGEKKLVGDVAFLAAKERASFITPVPGGVGPMTIAMLLQNTLQAAEWSLARS